MKRGVPLTPLLATCVTLAALLQLSVLSLLTCGQDACPTKSCSWLRAGALSWGVCKETVGIGICRQAKSQIQGQRKREREEGRVGAAGSLALVARGGVGEAPCLVPSCFRRSGLLFQVLQNLTPSPRSSRGLGEDLGKLGGPGCHLGNRFWENGPSCLKSCFSLIGDGVGIKVNYRGFLAII